MILSDLAVRRPVFAGVLALLLVLVGAVSYPRLAVRDLPDVEPPIVSVSTTYRGANSEVIENRITQVIEDQVAGIEGIEAITSISRDGSSNVVIEFSPTRNLDAAANDVRDRVSRVTRQLPIDVDPPVISKVDVDSAPILWLTILKPDWTTMQLTDYADRVLRDRFASINGVSNIMFGGEALPSMRVWLSRSRLVAYGMTSADVETALRAQNVELPAGRVEGPDTNLTVRVSRQFVTEDDFRRMIVGRGKDGYLVRLGDVARISKEPLNRYNMFRSNGQQSISLGIIRQSGANVLQVANDAKKELESVKQILPEGMEIAVSYDSSLFIDRAIKNVWITLFEAVFLVIAVIFLFLGSARATLIPAMTVPVCLIATFAVLYALGYSLNLLTLLGFVLAIGLVVDDAIVVLENIHYRMERGEPPLVASFRGANEVAFAVLATTIVVCAVFVPLYFIAGRTGLLFRELAGTMIGMLAFSGFVALAVTPMLCSKMLKPGIKHNRLTEAFNRLLHKFQVRYAKILDRILDRPLLVGGVAVGFVLVCVFLGSRLQSELAPGEDLGMFQINVQAAEGTGYDRMSQYMIDLEARIMPLVGNDKVIQRLLTRVPGGFNATESFNSGSMTAFLVPWEDRTIKTDEVIREVQQVINADPQVRGNASSGNTLSRGGRPLQLVISGTTYEELVKARNAIIAAAKENPGIIDIDSDYRETNPQLLLDIDTTRAGDLGVRITDIGATLETMMGSRRVTTFVDRGKEYYVILQAEDADRASPGDLTNIFVRSSRSGDMIPLSNLVKMREQARAGSLGRYNKQRSITLQGNLAQGTTLGEALSYLEKAALAQPEVTGIGYRGESYQLRQTGSSLWAILGLTVVLVFLVLAAQFESWVHPIVIILTVPLALGGGLFGLWIMGGTLNLYSQVGIVMLVGLAAKNGILIVEFANQLRDRGYAFRDAILEASQRRLRPVLMTSVATVAGAVPLMIAGGAGAGSRQAIGVVVVWGVSIATLLTLFVIPTFYTLLARRTMSPETISRELEREMQEVEAARGQPSPAE